MALQSLVVNSVERELDLIDADFSLHILQALLDDGDEGSRGHKGSIDVGLADVALYAEGEC